MSARELRDAELERLREIGEQKGVVESLRRSAELMIQAGESTEAATTLEEASVLAERNRMARSPLQIRATRARMYLEDGGWDMRALGRWSA